MLVEIKCDKFRNQVIKFNNSLNVILGDEKAANSIGKSTFLMVIDFVFGGNSFIKFNTDVFDELGHHDYLFCFTFGTENYRFKRNTYKYELIHKCDENYKEIEAISAKEFRIFLKSKYKIPSKDITFRSVVGLYSRIWGKGNLDVKKPLHPAQEQKSSACVENLIKLFNRYDNIRDLVDNFKQGTDERSALTKAFAKRIIPKINKTKYLENQKEIEIISTEIEDIKNNLAKYACNISEIANKVIMELKTKKDQLLITKRTIESKRIRIKRNIIDNKFINSKKLVNLNQFFPDVNNDRILMIEKFHSGLSNILKKELQRAEEELTLQLNIINGEISEVDRKIAGSLIALDDPNVIVDRVYELSKTLHSARSENKYFANNIDLEKNVKILKSELHDEKAGTLQIIANMVNEKIMKLITTVYDNKRKCPILTLGDANYKFEIFEDTGTGKAYSNLLLLDLSIFSLTSLPFLIHDSLLFKNIENTAVGKLVKIYASFEKQTFISIDEIDKYGLSASNTLRKNTVIELKNNALLYNKDWRK